MACQKHMVCTEEIAARAWSAIFQNRAGHVTPLDMLGDAPVDDLGRSSLDDMIQAQVALVRLRERIEPSRAWERYGLHNELSSQRITTQQQIGIVGATGLPVPDPEWVTSRRIELDDLESSYQTYVADLTPPSAETQEWLDRWCPKTREMHAEKPLVVTLCRDGLPTEFVYNDYSDL